MDPAAKQAKSVRAAAVTLLVRTLVVVVVYLAAASLQVDAGDAQAFASAAVSSTPAQGLDAPDQPYSEAADTQSGLILFAAVLRNSSTKTPGSNDQGGSPQRTICARHQLTSNDLKALNARPHMRSAMCGDAGSSRTTIPPPSV